MQNRKKQQAPLPKQRSASMAQARKAPGLSITRERAILTGVLTLSALVYFRCLGNGFVFDDDNMIVKNRFIGSPSFFWKSLVSDSWWFLDPNHVPQSSYYRPLQDIWFGIHFRLFGLNPFGWHATMVILNLIVVWLVFRIASRVTGDVYAAMVATVFFALIPVHAEAVVWASAIPLPMSAALELGALYLLMTRAAAPVWNWAIALLLYALALFSHEGAVTFPAVVAAYVFLLEPGDEADLASRFAPKLSRPAIRKIAICTAPFALETVAYLAIRYQVLGFINRPMPVNHMTNAQALLTIPRVLIGYVGLLIAPWTASPGHNLPIVSTASSPAFWAPLAAIVIIAAGFLWVLRNNRRRHLYLFCGVWMAIAMAPMLNLRGIFQGALLQDRYLYIPSIGWFVILADAAARFVRAGSRTRLRPALAAAGALAAVYAALLWNVQRYWHDDVALYTRLIEISPEQPSWHYAFGVALEQRGDFVGAERELGKAVELDPTTPALYDLGVVDSRLGNVKKAAAEEAEGLKRLPNVPADSWVGLAQVYDLAGDHGKSEEALQKAESMPGGAYVAALARAQMSINHKDFAAAEKILRELSAAQPNDPRVWAMLGIVTGSQKNFAEALSNFDRAIALAPRDTFSRFWAAYTLYRLGRIQDAIDQCRTVLALSPNDRNAQVLLAKLQSKLASSQPTPN